ncbi:condensation domain-containing protein [Streptomyces sp. NPDC088258]|uniref:condensation domain-containing protein n=1 Tax=Streptomyces sp. NPDC088258 TaxID=3365849 RepID=UPI003809A420
MHIEDIHIRGSRGGASAPLTWAQQDKWDSLQTLEGHQGNLNTVLELPIPHGLEVSAGLSALARLVQDCETLRTTYSDAGGELRQTVRSEYSMPVEIYDIPAGRGVRELTDETFSEHLDYTKSPPVRVALFSHRGKLHSASLIASPLVSDAMGGALLSERYLGHLRGTTLPPLGRQPLEQAAYELSPDGKPAGAKGVKHWADRLSKLSAPLLPPSSRNGSKTLRMLLTSPLALHSVDRFVGLSRSLRSAVYFGALAQRLCRHFDVPQCPLPVMSSNRNTESSRDYIGVLAQRSIALFDSGRDGSIAGSRSANREVFLSLLNGAYDPAERNQTERSIAVRRGFKADDFHYHANFLSHPRTRTEQDLTPAEIARLGESTTLEEEAPMSKSNWHFLVQFDELESDLGITMFANPSCFSRNEMRDFLTALEQDLISLAFR